MSTRDSRLDAHLQALFSGLDTRADFDARLMARLRAESQADALERARRARQAERARYVRARSGLRHVTLDTLGIALLVLLTLLAAWPQVRPVALDILRQHGPYVAICLSLVTGAVPLLGIWMDQSRRPIRLL